MTAQPRRAGRRGDLRQAETRAPAPRHDACRSPGFQAAVCLALVLALAGCAADRSPGPYAPGIAQGAAAVDGLTVGHRLMEAGEPELAIKAYLRAVAERGPEAEVLASLGSANLQLGRLGQAERLLRRAVEADATFVPAWNNLGVVLMEQDRAAEAVPAFERAVALDGGESAAIEDNLKLALSRRQATDYPAPDKPRFALVRRGAGDVLIQRMPN